MSVLPVVKKDYGKLKNFVNGEWVDSTTGKWLDFSNPATTEAIGQVPLSTVDETKAAIEAAQDAWWSWREAPPVSRARLMFNPKDGAAANIDEEVLISPLGVFAAVCPFNFPGMVPFWFWPYAVATGNTFIVKPSEQVPMTTQYMFKMIEEAGFPPGVINLVSGREDAVNTFFNHKDVKGVSRSEE